MTPHPHTDDDEPDRRPEAAPAVRRDPALEAAGAANGELQAIADELLALPYALDRRLLLAGLYRAHQAGARGAGQ